MAMRSFSWGRGAWVALLLIVSVLATGCGCGDDDDDNDTSGTDDDANGDDASDDDSTDDDVDDDVDDDTADDDSDDDTTDDDSDDDATDDDSDDDTTDDDTDDDTGDDDTSQTITINSKVPAESDVSQDVGTGLTFSVDAASELPSPTWTFHWTLDGAPVGDGTDTLQLALIASMVSAPHTVTVEISDGLASSTVEVSWTLTVNSIAHADMNVSYTGPQTCAVCHPESLDEVMGSTHYLFDNHTPEDFVQLLIWDPIEGEWAFEGDYLESARTGKLHKLCLFPHSYAGANWIGILNAGLQSPGGCGRCHIANGTPPHSVTATAEPSDEQKNSVDCLICHASNYTWNIASNRFPTQVYDPASNDPYNAWSTGLRFPFDTRVEAFQSVGAPTHEACLRCHNFAGGGFHAKRGSGFDLAQDVHHANAQFECTECHSAGGHRTKRGGDNLDTWAFDTMEAASSCDTCHGAAPHPTPGIGAVYNMHSDKIACQTCHTSRDGCCGVVHKDFTQLVYNNSKGVWDFAVVVENGIQSNIEYRWFNGKGSSPLIPLGTPDDKIYPFKRTTAKKLVDIDGHTLPLKLGILFKNGPAGTDNDMNGWDDNFDLAAKQGYRAGTLIGGLAHPDYNPATNPSPIAGTVDETEYFNLSHSIVKSGALTCVNCHSQTNSVLDWEALGIANPNPM